MINRRTTLGLLASVTSLAATGTVFAQKANQKEKKAKKHQNGRQLVGDKIKQDGRHKVGKAGKSDVEVDVKAGKVAGLSAKHPQKGNLPVQKVKSKQKMADAAPGVILAAAGDMDRVQLAQNSDWYYAYWFEEDEADYYYWFTADEVYVDSSWVEYYG